MSYLSKISQKWWEWIKFIQTVIYPTTILVARINFKIPSPNYGKHNAMIHSIRTKCSMNNTVCILECVPKPSTVDEAVINFASNKWPIILNPLQRPCPLYPMDSYFTFLPEKRKIPNRSKAIYVDDITFASSFVTIPNGNKTFRLSSTSPFSFFSSLWILSFEETALFAM